MKAARSRTARALGCAAALAVLACGTADDGGGGLDITLPMLLSSAPAAGGSLQDLSAPLRLDFSEALDPASVTPASITVTLDGAPVPGRLVSGGPVVTFEPTGGWAAGRRYVVTVTVAVHDLAGNPAIATSFEFTT